MELTIPTPTPRTAFRNLREAGPPPDARRSSVSIGQRIKQHRELRNLSQRAMAELLSYEGLPVDASAVSRIEADVRDLRVSELLIIAEALAVEPTMLINGLSTSAESKQAYSAGYHDALDYAMEAIRRKL